MATAEWVTLDGFQQLRCGFVDVTETSLGVEGKENSAPVKDGACGLRWMKGTQEGGGMHIDTHKCLGETFPEEARTLTGVASRNHGAKTTL